MVGVELAITWFSFFALSYQPSLNTSIRSYAVYGLTISTNYHYSGHNRSYLTISRIYRIQKKVALVLWLK